METILVNISWQDNYGASSNDILGCVAAHDTLEGIKKEFLSAVQFHLKGLELDEIPPKLKGSYKFHFILDKLATKHQQKLKQIA